MTISGYFRTVPVTTDSIDYELLTDAYVKASIMERLSLTSQAYDALIQTGLTSIYFQILGSDFNVSINDDIYQPLFDNTVYTTSDYTVSKIKSIRISDNSKTLQFRYDIL